MSQADFVRVSLLEDQIKELRARVEALETKITFPSPVIEDYEAVRKAAAR